MKTAFVVLVRHPAWVCCEFFPVLMGIGLLAAELQAQTPEALIARTNASFNAEALTRAKRCADAVLSWRTAPSGLLYDAPYDKVWRVNNSAADLYPFVVLTTYFTDPAGYAGPMLDILNTESSLTSRDLGDGQRIMPDDWNVVAHTFNNGSPNADRQTYGTTEYMKDGLMPITEWLGPLTPWYSRMLSMMDYLWNRQANLVSDQGVGLPRANPDSFHVSNLEIHGEHLQVLLRLFWRTGQQKYLDWTQRLGDHYLLGTHHLTDNLSSLRLRDHGNELIGGLSELYATLSQVNPAKAAEYRTPLFRAFDRILEVGRNSDGLFYNSINPQTGVILDAALADTFGYVYNGYYTVYLTDKDHADPAIRAKADAYRDAMRTALTNLDKAAYHDFPWESPWNADGYADAIEGALNLFNRERLFASEHWLDTEVRVFWGIQRTNGFANEVYADGNFIRTTLMFALWKSRGIHADPWTGGLGLGATEQGGGLCVVLQAPTNGWNGKLVFDRARHSDYLHLPFDWPRINQFPEWFTADISKRYRVTRVGSGAAADYSGAQLQDGIGLTLPAGPAEAQLLVRGVIAEPASNRPPNLAALANLAARPGEKIVLTPNAADPDGDALAFFAGNLPPGLSLDPATGVISGTLASDAVQGTFPIALTVTDASGFGSSRTFLFTIEPPTGPGPSLLSPVNAVAEHNRLDTDVAGNNGASGNTIDGSGFTGGINLASNPGGVLATVLPQLWYVKGSVQGPAVAPPQSIFYNLGAMRTVAGAALWIEETDPNIGWPTAIAVDALPASTNALNFNLTNLEAQTWTTALGETSVNTNIFTGQVFSFPTAVQTRYLRLRMTACYMPDYAGTNLLAWGFNEFAVILGNISTNHPPVVSSLPARVTPYGTAVSFSVAATDPDPGDIVTYSASGLPAGVTIDSVSGIIQGSPTAESDFAVTVTATDYEGAKGISEFSWTVIPGSPADLFAWATGTTSPAASLALDGSTPPFRVRYSRALAAAMLNVFLEQSTNLTTWVTCSPVTRTASSPTADVYEYQIPSFSEQPASFFRLRIGLP